MHYAGKYIGKDCVFLDPENPGCMVDTGRYWGVWRRELFPVVMKRQTLDCDAALDIRRALRRYLQSKGAIPRRGLGRSPGLGMLLSGQFRGFSMFVPSTIVAKLVAYYCWWLKAGFASFREVFDLRVRVATGVRLGRVPRSQDG
jgi:hypothetical protein